LLGRVQSRGQQALARLNDPWPGLAEPRRRAAGRLWAVAVVWLVAGLIQPALVTTAAGRFIWPAAGDAPFSLTRLAVTVEPERIEPGSDVTVAAAASGPRPSEAALVRVDDAGRAVGRLAMQPAGDARFTRRLFDVRKPMRVRVEAGRAQSDLITLRPRAAAKRDEQTTPSSAAGDGGDPNKPTERATGNQPASASATQPASATSLAALERQLRQLAKQLRALPQQPGQRNEAGGQTSPPKRNAQASALAQALEQTASQLASTQRSSATDAASQTTPTEQSAAAQALIDQARQLIRQAQRLAGRTADAPGAAAAGSGQPATGGASDGQTPADAAPSIASGTAVETLDQTAGQALPAGFEWRQVPEAYRQRVADYFSRLNQPDRETTP
jgi:hypothetical protein